MAATMATSSSSSYASDEYIDCSSIGRREFLDGGLAAANAAVAAEADSYTRKISVDSAGGSVFGSRTLSDFSEEDEDDLAAADDGINAQQHTSVSETQSLYSNDCQEIVKQILQHDHPIRITIKLHVFENKFTTWESVLNPINNILYVAMPEVLPPEASKQTFISLLEFAEEKLDVDAVVLVVRKNRSDRPRLIETFLIMGFEPLSRKSPLAPPAAEKDNENFFLIYHIEDDDDDDENDDDLVEAERSQQRI